MRPTGLPASVVLRQGNVFADSKAYRLADGDLRGPPNPDSALLSLYLQQECKREMLVGVRRFDGGQFYGARGSHWRTISHSCLERQFSKGRSTVRSRPAAMMGRAGG